MHGSANWKQGKTQSRLNATPDLVAARAAGYSTPLSFSGGNIDAAKRAVKAIRDGVKVVAQQPGMGRPVQDMEPQYREWLIDFGDSGYIALYRYDGQTAVILAVRHQKEVGY